MRLDEQTKVALYTALNVSGVTTLATGGVFADEAPLTTTYPFLIIEKASNVPAYTFGFTEIMQEMFWHVKAYTEKGTTSAQRLGSSIIEAALTAIGQDLTLSAGTCLGVMYESDLPVLKEILSDRNIYMTGVRLRIWVNSEAAAETYYLTYNGDYLTYNGDRLTYNP